MPFHDFSISACLLLRLGWGWFLSGFCSFRSALRGPCTAAPAAHPGPEGRRAPGVLGILLAEFFQGFPFLAASKPYVHPDQNREHCQSGYRWPLQEETRHDKDETQVLRMPQPRIGSGGCHLVLLLGFEKNAPG